MEDEPLVMYLYMYDYNDQGQLSHIQGEEGTDYQATLSIYSDGSIILNQDDSAAVPLPAGFVLLFTGMMALLGLHKKKR